MGAVTDILAPLEQEGTKSVVRKWLKAVGDPVRVNDPIVELETDKVSVEVGAEADGVLAEILLAEGADAGPGAILGRMTAGGVASAPAAVTLAPAAQTTVAPAGGSKSIAEFDPGLRLSPSVRRRLIETEIDPRTLTGSGRDGRLTRADVDAAAAAPAKPAPAAAPAAAAEVRPASAGGVTTIPHDTMRRRIAEHMSHSVTVAPHVTAVFEADFSAIMAHRKANRAEFERQGVNLTFMAYIVAACCRAMAAAPTVNARWFDDRLDVYDDVNVGIGASLGDKGLVVPVVHRANGLTLLQLARRIGDLTERARNGKLTPADVRDGTFSISNHGVSGTLVAAPIIINQPQSAILGVGKLEKRVVVREVDGADTLQIRPMAYVSLTIDHRVLDGHQTNAWLTRFVETLEGWGR